MKGSIKKLHRKESGSALILGVITMWFIVYFISMVGNVATGVANKMKAQMAADTAALSGARMMANTLSTMAWINDSRAMLHYYKMRYGADLIAAGVLARMKVSMPVVDVAKKEFGPSIRNNSAIESSLGVPGFVTQFTDLFEEYTEERKAPWQDAYPEYWEDREGDETFRQIKGQHYEEHLARIQHTLGLVSRVMVEKEVYDKAAENGSELTAFFPKFTMYPKPDSYRKLYIEALSDIDYDDDDNVIDEAGWYIYSEDGELDLTVLTRNDEEWIIDYTFKERHVHTEINKGDPSEDWLHIEYTETKGEESETKHVWINAELGLIITDEFEVTIEELDDGSTLITKTDNETGEVTEFRFKYENGVLMVWDEATQSFIDPNANDDGASNTIDIGGTEVRVEDFTSVGIGGAMFYLDRVDIYEFTIWYNVPVKVTSHIYGYSIRAEDDWVRINGLNTKTADCRWKVRWGNWVHGTNDMRRHRMCVLEENKFWAYEEKVDGGYMEQELAQDREEFEFDRYSELHGKARVNKDHDHTQEELWKDILDVRTGSLSRDENANILYNQVRECWHPLDINCNNHKKASELAECEGVNGYYHNSDGKLRRCEICNPNGDKVSEDPLFGKGIVSAEDLLLHPPEDESYEGFTYVNQEDARDIPELVEMLQQYPYIMESIKRQPSTNRKLPPLVLSEYYFKHGISVGVWISGDNILGSEATPEMNLPDEDEVFAGGENGYYAFACARAGFKDPESGEYVWSFSEESGYDEDGKLIERQNWLASPQNLYLSDWEASLVPMKTQIKSLDIDADEEADSGLTYLIRRMNTTSWRKTYFDRNQHSGGMRIDGFNWNDQRIYDLLNH
ncbi:MAG: Tad domain-containing protein [Planctomycetes bacterium]|nr:Tad domain-containing protein [Planctomycetota bacterium]